MSPLPKIIWRSLLILIAVLNAGPLLAHTTTDTQEAKTPNQIFDTFLKCHNKTATNQWTLDEVIALQLALNANALVKVVAAFNEEKAIDATHTNLPTAEVQNVVGVERPAPTSILDPVGKYVSIQKSFIGGEPNSDPAKLGWTWGRHESSYSFDGALVLRGLPLFWWGESKSTKDREPGELPTKFESRNHRELSKAWTIDATPVLEAHVSSDTNAASDTLTAAIPVWFIRSLATSDSDGPLGITSFQAQVTPQFQTDSRFKAKTIEANPLFTFTQPNWGIGTYLPKVDAARADPEAQKVAFIWQPYAGFETGFVVDDAGDPELRLNGTIARFVTKVHGEIILGQRYVITGDFGYRHLLNGDHHDYLYGEISPQIKLDSSGHLTIGATLKTGKQPLAFVDEHSANLWLGLQF